MKNETLGEIIKQLVKMNGMSVITFANALQISRENVYAIFKRDSFDSALLWKMSVILKHNLFKYLSNQLENDQKRALGEIKKIGEMPTTAQDLKLELLQRENQSLKREIELLKEINDLLKSKNLQES